MSEIKVSEIRVSKISVSEIRVSKIRVSKIRVSKIRISSNHRELHGAIFAFHRVTFQFAVVFKSGFDISEPGRNREAAFTWCILWSRRNSFSFQLQSRRMPGRSLLITAKTSSKWQHDCHIIGVRWAEVDTVVTFSLSEAGYHCSFIRMGRWLHTDTAACWWDYLSTSFISNILQRWAAPQQWKVQQLLLEGLVWLLLIGSVPHLRSMWLESGHRQFQSWESWNLDQTGEGLTSQRMIWKKGEPWRCELRGTNHDDRKSEGSQQQQERGCEDAQAHGGGVSHARRNHQGEIEFLLCATPAGLVPLLLSLVWLFCGK